MIYQSNAVMLLLVIYKGYEYADKIFIDTLLQQLEEMASNCDGVDVVVISSAWLWGIPNQKIDNKAVANSGFVLLEMTEQNIYTRTKPTH